MMEGIIVIFAILTIFLSVVFFKFGSGTSNQHEHLWKSWEGRENMRWCEGCGQIEIGNLSSGWFNWGHYTEKDGLYFIDGDIGK